MTDKSYIENYSISDQALIERLGDYIKHHRLNQNKTQDEVARAAGISRSTLSLLERGESVNLITFIQVLRVLDLLHALKTFEIEEVISPLQLAKLDQKKRERARSKTEDRPKSDW